jgi:hypothetical protein
MGGMDMEADNEEIAVLDEGIEESADELITCCKINSAHMKAKV